MESNDIFNQEAPKGLTMDKIIEKFIPIVGAIFLTIWLGYLLYTNIWIDLALPLRLWFGFFVSLTIIWWAVSMSDKLRYFADIIIWGGILLLYGTLMYWSRTTDLASAVIPEVATLVTAVVFTIIIAYFASSRKSKVILMLSMIWAYMTPFIIWQNDVWVQNISFNAYLTYFATVNIAVFLIWKELSIRNIIPLNMLWLFVGTSTLYHLSYSEWISSIATNSFFSSEIFSAILFLFLSIFSMWSIIITSKQFEEKDEWYIAFWYIATILWFIFNLWLLGDISDITKTVFFALLSWSCFYGWYFLRSTKTRFQHISLYAWWILSLVLAFFNLIPELNTYSSLAIAYSSLIFGWIYMIDSTKIERLISYGLLSLIWAILSILYIYDWGVESFRTLHIVLALVPAMAWYFIAKHWENENHTELAMIYSVSAFVLAVMFIVVEFLQYFNLWFLVYFIPTLSALIYISVSEKISDNTKSIVLRSSIIWFLLGYIGIFFTLLGSIYPAPTDIFIFTGNWALWDWTLIKWVFASVILFLWLSISRDLQTRQETSRPSFVLVILGYTSLLLIVNYIILAIMNDLSISSEHWWYRAIAMTIWWVLIAIFMLVTWVKKWYIYRSEKLLWLLLLGLTLLKVILYDLSTMDMQNKIIILMVVGWALMMFSYLVHTKGWLKSDNGTDSPKVDLNEILSQIDISWINKITFNVNDDKALSTTSKNTIKIVKYVTDKFWKTNFNAWELNDVYKYINTNYKTDLDKKTYDTVTNALKKFVDKWWEIIFS